MDNFDKILDFIENPGKYTDKEIDAILADSESLALYESLSAMAGGHFASGLPYGEENVEKEWRSFEQKQREPAWRVFLRQRRAAVITVVVASSLVAIATGVAVSMAVNGKREQTATEIVTTAGTSTVSSANATGNVVAGQTESEMSALEPVEFTNESLENILDSITSGSGMEVHWLSDNPRGLRLFFVWDRNRPVSETLERLDGFEQISLSVRNDTVYVK